MSEPSTLPGNNLTPKDEADFDKIQEKVDKGPIDKIEFGPQEKEILRKKYGFAWSIFANDTSGSLFRLLGRAIKQDYTAEMFTAELAGTRWARERDKDEEAYYVFENQNKRPDGEFLPEYTNTLARLKEKIKQEVLRQTGQLINPDEYESDIKLWWQNNYTRTNNAVDLGNFVKGLFVKKFEDLVELGGTLGDDQDRVRAYAADMGINLTDSQTAAYARRIALGEGTIDTTEDDIRAQAIKLYPGLKKSLDSGVTVKDIADIYINQTARLLEINPERISLTDTKGPGKFVSQALNYMGQDGMPSQMPLYEFNRLLRSSEDWQKTENARDTYMDFGLKLAQKMGF